MRLRGIGVILALAALGLFVGGCASGPAGRSMDYGGSHTAFHETAESGGGAWSQAGHSGGTNAAARGADPTKPIPWKSVHPH